MNYGTPLVSFHLNTMFTGPRLDWQLELINLLESGSNRARTRLFPRLSCQHLQVITHEADATTLTEPVAKHSFRQCRIVPWEWLRPSQHINTYPLFARSPAHDSRKAQTSFTYAHECSGRPDIYTGQVQVTDRQLFLFQDIRCKLQIVKTENPYTCPYNK